MGKNYKLLKRDIRWPISDPRGLREISLSEAQEVIRSASGGDEWIERLIWAFIDIGGDFCGIRRSDSKEVFQEFVRQYGEKEVVRRGVELLLLLNRRARVKEATKQMKLRGN